jgi:TolB-like protein/DNA-binding winged helix-turn-helix (wHTH) protein
LALNGCPINGIVLCPTRQEYRVPAPTHKFGDFELDPSGFELRRQDRPLKLERIPMELLILLLEKNGQVVSRQEIIERLWGKDVFMDTEHGINTAIRKIRTVLREDVERPRFIQTISGKGYRFVPGEVSTNANGDRAAANISIPANEVLTPASLEAGQNRTKEDSASRKWPWAAVALLAVAAALLALNVAGLRDRVFARNQIGPIHSIAVLPLANLSGDASQEYFADGMTDELITALAKNRSLRVVSRTSAMQYKGVRQPLPNIARELGVDGILEGSVQRSGNRVHMTAQLIYAATDTHIWAESYDRDLSGALSLPDELAQMVVHEAKVASAPVRPPRYVSPEAHDSYLHGRYLWFGGNNARSREYFEKAIQLQPDYAAAWDGLGDTYGASAVEGEIPPQEAFAKAEAAARKALELDDSLPEAHNSLAAFYLFNAWDWHRAESESARAVELNPNYAEGRHIHSYTLYALNRDDEALQEQKRATEIDPFARPWALGGAYIHLRQYDAAINELGARAEIQPQDPTVQFFLSEAYRFKGIKNEAALHAEQSFLAAGDNKSAAAVRHAFERGGIPAMDQWFLSQDLDQARKNYVSPFTLAYDYAHLERKEETLRDLEDSYRERSPKLLFIQKEPVFDFLHSEPRYRDIVTKMGLPPAY